MELVKNINRIINDIFKILSEDVNELGIEIMDRGVPHIPKGLPKNRRAVYIFIYEKKVLKVGKVGANSNARFLSQHYHPNSAGSTLAKSILNDREMDQYKITEENISNWIKNNCRRVDILIDSNISIFYWRFNRVNITL